MIATNYKADISRQAYTSVPIALSEADLAAHTALANTVIVMALADDHYRRALQLDLLGPSQPGHGRTGRYGIGGARNSADSKVHLHTGYQSADHARRMAPGIHHPPVWHEFWESQRAVLQAVETSSRAFLEALGASAVAEAIFDGGPAVGRNVHLRTVRYNNAATDRVGAEIVGGHADQGLASLHLFETHGGWLQGATYESRDISDDTSEARQAAIREMRLDMQPIIAQPGTATAFLGTTWPSFPAVQRAGLASLPVLYHAGFKPTARKEHVSPYAQAVTDNLPNRISTVAFLSPNLQLLKAGVYTLPSVERCRPTYR